MQTMPMWMAADRTPARRGNPRTRHLYQTFNIQMNT